MDRRLHAPGWGRHFLHRAEFVADRLEGAELVLAFAEVIGIGPVSGIGGLFRSHREILVETGLLRPVHGLHIGCDIPGFLDVRTPERRKFVSFGVAGDTRSFALAVIAVARGTGLREDLGAG